MPTKVYGAIDELIEFDGDIDDEVNIYSDDESSHGGLILFSDGTLLQIKYGKAKMAIWQVTVILAGTLFDRLEIRTDEDAEIASDIAHFKDGLRWAYVAREWERAG